MILIIIQMIDYIKDLLASKANGSSLILFAIATILSIFVIVCFVKIVKSCFAIEKNTQIESHTLIKTILIAAVPTVYSILSAINIADSIPINIVITVTVVVCIAISVWNIVSFGLIYGIMFSVMHLVFGFLASLGIGALIFIGVAAVVLSLFAGGSTGGSSASSSSAPEYVRDPATGETVRVEKGANGELYVGGTSTVLRQGDYAGEYIDSNGNRYIS